MNQLAGVLEPSNPTDPSVRVLIVDDEDTLRGTLARVLRSRGMQVETAANAFLALEVIERTPLDVVLADVRMPGMTGPQLLSRIKARACPVEVIMMTAFADIPTTVSAVKAGAHGFLTKPFVSNESVVLEILNAAECKRLREKTARLERELSTRPPAGEMLGACAGMRAVHRMIDAAGTTSSTILVTGESGTGKELAARAIHARSRRAAQPFVAVNCAAIPRELVESELFGQARAVMDYHGAARSGAFEIANGGTLFLDDIGDLPTSAQVKLLRTLQSGEIRPVGSNVGKTVDVRVIASTNADLKANIGAGTFRQDLFYRLNVIRIELPALRDRGDDVLLLAQHFVRKYANAVGRLAPVLSPEAALCLEKYAWPGNIRELEHAIEHAVVFAEESNIRPSALPPEVRRQYELALEETILNLTPPTSRDEHLGTSYSAAKKKIVAAFNRSYIEKALQATNGNVSEAARRSGLDRSNFRRLLRLAKPKTGAQLVQGSSLGDLPPRNQDS